MGSLVPDVRNLLTLGSVGLPSFNRSAVPDTRSCLFLVSFLHCPSLAPSLRGQSLTDYCNYTGSLRIFWIFLKAPAPGVRRLRESQRGNLAPKNPEGSEPG